MNPILLRSLVLTLLCSASPSPAAVMNDASGRGQVLLYPYYTVQGGMQTLLTVVNHSNSGKAVKVRFREGRNGREVAAFNLYLGEFDVWTAALFSITEDGPAHLLTHDRSCTVPGIQTSIAVALPRLPDGTRYLSFHNRDYSGARFDSGPTDLARGREGYVELIEMGTLINNSDSDIAATTVSGVPISCATLETAWAAGGYWRFNANIDLLPPSGQLSGSLSIVQPLAGELYTVQATALSGFSVVTQHKPPESGLPDLASAHTDPAGQVVEALVIADGQVLRSRWQAILAIDAVSAVLTQASRAQQFLRDPALGSQSEWLLSFPTKRFYTDPAMTGGVVLPPFTHVYGAREGNRPRCELFNLAPFNREQARPIGCIDFATAPPPPYDWCHVTLPLAPVPRGITASLLRSPLARLTSMLCPEQPDFASGFLELGSGGSLRPSIEGHRYLGHPAIGFHALRFSNGARTFTQAESFNTRTVCTQEVTFEPCVSAP